MIYTIRKENTSPEEDEQVRISEESNIINLINQQASKMIQEERKEPRVFKATRKKM
jgi:hypothetical protein